MICRQVMHTSSHFTSGEGAGGPKVQQPVSVLLRFSCHNLPRLAAKVLLSGACRWWSDNSSATSSHLNVTLRSTMKGAHDSICQRMRLSARLSVCAGAHRSGPPACGPTSRAAALAQPRRQGAGAAAGSPRRFLCLGQLYRYRPF